MCWLRYSGEISIFYCKLDQFQNIREINVCHLCRGLDQSTKCFLLFANRLPIVDLNKAYIGSKFAIYVEPDSYQPKEAQANFSAMKNHEKSKSRPTPNCSFDVESNTSKAGESRLTTEFRRMKLLSDLDDLMED